MNFFLNKNMVLFDIVHYLLIIFKKNFIFAFIIRFFLLKNIKKINNKNKKFIPLKKKKKQQNFIF